MLGFTFVLILLQMVMTNIHLLGMKHYNKLSYYL